MKTTALFLSMLLTLFLAGILSAKVSDYGEAIVLRFAEKDLPKSKGGI